MDRSAKLNSVAGLHSSLPRPAKEAIFILLQLPNS